MPRHSGNERYPAAPRRRRNREEKPSGSFSAVRASSRLLSCAGEVSDRSCRPRLARRYVRPVLARWLHGATGAGCPRRTATARYAIDGGLAGKSRLDVLAEVMWPTSAALLAAAGVPVGARCLDLGCGGGHVSVELAGLVGLTGSVVGVDIDAEIIDLARAAAAVRGLGNLEFRACTADDFGDELFDLGYARFLLSHVADPQRVVSGLAAVMAPGGKVIVEDVDFTGAFCFPRSEAYTRSVHL